MFASFNQWKRTGHSSAESKKEPERRTADCQISVSSSWIFSKYRCRWSILFGHSIFIHLVIIITVLLCFSVELLCHFLHHRFDKVNINIGMCWICNNQLVSAVTHVFNMKYFKVLWCQILFVDTDQITPVLLCKQN